MSLYYEKQWLAFNKNFTGDVVDARVLTTTSTITSMQDADADTKVEVEVTSDADEIQFTAAGTAIAKVTSAGILPNVNSNGSTGFDLGASNFQWKDVYVSSGSLYVNGKQVLQDDSGTITISTTTNQDLKMNTSGTGDLKIECAAGGNIELNGDIQLNATNKVVSHWTTGNVKIDGSSITNVADGENLNLVTTGAGVINFADNVTAAGSVVITGDLTVNGTTTTVSSTNTTVTDPLILLNKDASGSNAKDLGLVFERGSDTNQAMIWDESADQFAFISTSEDGTTAGDVTVSGYANLRVATLTGTATAAQYADLAERYEADAQYDAGTVVVFGGEKEISMANGEYDHRVAGVISSAPAYMMNSEAGDDATHPYVALTGRVPCKVTGTINKGDILTTSAMAGHAMAGEAKAGHMIGKALENFDGESGVIEVLVNLM